MKKILIVGFVVFANMYGSTYNVNMDKKVYYDADRTQNEIYAKQAEVLEKFIKSKVDKATYEAYKNGKVKLSAEELELQANGGQTNKKTGFFANILDQIGLGGSKTTSSSASDKKPGFMARMLEKIGIGSTKQLSKDDKAIQPTTTTTDTKTTPDTQSVTQDTLQTDGQNAATEKIQQQEQTATQEEPKQEETVATSDEPKQEETAATQEEPKQEEQAATQEEVTDEK